MFLHRKSIITSLAIILLMMVNGLAYPKIVAHTFHHMHHTADTHGSPLCSWVCTAGQMEESSGVKPAFGLQVIDTIDSLPHHLYLTLYFAYQNARGPPASF